jgi:intein-encoded DNA endonuclease-like protein
VPGKFSPIKDRLRVYELVREAVKTGRYKGPAQFAREVESSGFRPPSRGTIRRWANGATSPFSGKRIFDGQPSPELSFFLGAWIGDGWADENDGGKRMLLKVRSYDFAKEFAECAAKILGKTDSYWVRRVTDKAGKWYLVKVTSFMLYEFANRPLADLRKSIEAYPRGFLRGIFTAEGNPSVSIEQTRGPYLSVGLEVSNNDYSLLEFLRHLLFGLGFHPGEIRININKGERTNLGVARQTGWHLSLSRVEDARQFVGIIGFADSEKQIKLTEAISLLDNFGWRGAASEWSKLYKKGGKKWTRMSNVSS